MSDRFLRLLQRSFLGVLATLTLVSGAAHGQPLLSQSSAGPPPHIVFLMMDDLGYGSLGATGSQHFVTPEIDALRAQGTLFTQYTVKAPVCSPARASILTGQDPRVWNVRGALDTGKTSQQGRFSQVGIPAYTPALPRYLAGKSYRTVHLGKWHVGGIDQVADPAFPMTDPELTPTGLGFDEWAIRVPSMSTAGVGYYDEFLQTHDAAGFELADCTPATCFGLQPPVHFTAWVLAKAANVVQQHAIDHPSTPLFLNLWLRAPHSPFNSPASLADPTLTEAEKYVALVEYADSQIGPFVAALDAALGSNNVLLVITSDNGAPFTMPTNSTPNPILASVEPNGKLFGQKGRLWEGGLRVPLIVRWPDGGVPVFGTSGFPANSTDWLPTFADLLDDDVEALAVEGQSILAQLTSPTTAASERDRRLLFEQEGRAVRSADWKIRTCGANGAPVTFDFSQCSGLSCDEGIGVTHQVACDPSTNPVAEDPNDPAIEAVADELVDRWLGWREDTTEVHAKVASALGSAVDRAGLLDFPAADGQLTLCTPATSTTCDPDPRINISNQAWTVSLKVRPDATDPSPTDASAWLVGREGSWWLELLDDGRLRFSAIDGFGTPPTNLAVAETGAAIPLGQWSNLTLRIANSVFDDDGDPNTPPVSSRLLSIYRGDQVIGSFHALRLHVAVNDNPIVVGATGAPGSLDRRFVGSISGLRFFTDKQVREQIVSTYRQELAWNIHSTRGTPATSGAVLGFSQGPGQVTLCLEDSTGCSKDHPLFDPRSDGLTLSTLVRPTAQPSGLGLLVGKNDLFRLYLQSDRTVLLRLFDTAGASHDLVHPTPLEVDRWTPVAFTMTPSTGGADVTLTVAGTTSSPLTVDLGGGNKSVVAGSRWGGGLDTNLIQPFVGDLTALRLFFGALEDTAVERLARGEIFTQASVHEGTPRISADGGLFFFEQAGFGVPGEDLDQVELCALGHRFPPDLQNCESANEPVLEVGKEAWTLQLEARRAAADSGTSRLIAKDGSWFLHLINGKPRLRVTAPTCSPANCEINAAQALPIGRWSRLTVQATPRSDGQVDIALFVDDSPVGSPLVVDAVGFDPDKRWVLGSHFGTKPFHGAIRDLRFYRQAVAPLDAARLDR